MEFDTTHFGYGAGLVMVGWICGMVVGLVISTLKNIARNI